MSLIELSFLGHIESVVDEYQQEMWQEFEKRKKARHIAVPTEDVKVCKDTLSRTLLTHLSPRRRQFRPK